MASHNFPTIGDVITVNGEQYKLITEPTPTEDIECGKEWYSSEFVAQAYSVNELNSEDLTIGVYNIAWDVLPEYANVAGFTLKQWEAACDWAKPLYADDYDIVSRDDL